MGFDTVRDGQSDVRYSSRMALPILYSFRRCPYAMRARMALLVSGVACELREVKLARKPAAMLDASPKGTVPVLVLKDGRVIDESLDIMRWALGCNDPEGWLTPDASALIVINDGPFKHHLDRYKYPERHGEDPVEHRGAAIALLRPLEMRLSATPYLCGPSRSLADVALFPFIRQFAETDRAFFDALDLPRLQAWLVGHLESELFAQAMARHEPWSPGQAPVYLKFSGVG